MDDKKGFSSQLKKVILAGMGAVAMAQDEVENLIKKLVERGEIAEEEGKKWLKEFLDKSKKGTKNKIDSIEEKTLFTLETLLKKLNIPTQKDIKEIANKIDKLSKRVEELEKKIKKEEEKENNQENSKKENPEEKEEEKEEEKK